MIRVAFISDTHFGHGYGEPIGEDAFRQAGEALDEAIARKADLIVIPGDIFDSRVPKQEVWAEALKVLQKPLNAPQSRAKFVELLGKPRKINPIAFRGIPVIAIHGTHERMGGVAVNPLHVLHEAGYLIHLHCNAAVFDVAGERIAIHGFSGVPEHYVTELLKQWIPKPVPGAKNVMIFHQNVRGYLYAGDDEEAYLNLSDIPTGFDLLVDGHIHTPQYDEKKHFLVAGSTVMTQQSKGEAEKPKGWWLAEFGDTARLEFIPIKAQRPLFVKELNFKSAEPRDVVEKARIELRTILLQKHAMQPLIRLKLTGTLKQGVDGVGITDDAITSGFDALVTVSKEFDDTSFKHRIEALREKQQAKLTPEERGLRIVSDMLAEAGYKGIPPEDIIDLLAEGEADAVIQKVLEKAQKSG